MGEDIAPSSTLFLLLLALKISPRFYQEWSDDLGNLAQMWSDKCEWKHGFTNFGAWHPTTSFRSKTVGKQQRTTDSAPVLKIHTVTCEIDFNINNVP